jgi:hypothetical protein
VTRTETRFFKKVDIESNGPDGCWDWLGTPTNDGYGQIRIHRKTIRAHRFSYEYFCRMEIPKGMMMDHICRNRLCVRPDHLRLATSRQNALENSTGKSALNSQKTHCKNGHPYDISNILFCKTRYGTARRCSICTQEYNSRYRELHRESLRSYIREWRKNHPDYNKAFMRKERADRKKLENKKEVSA